MDPLSLWSERKGKNPLNNSHHIGTLSYNNESNHIFGYVVSYMTIQIILRDLWPKQNGGGGGAVLPWATNPPKSECIQKRTK